MASRKLKTTGIGRFLIFLIIVAPLIYLGASYYKGQDGLQNLKDLFGSGSSVETVRQTDDSEVVTNSELARLRDELTAKEQRNKQLYLENEQLKKELTDVREELGTVRDQLERIKSAVN